MEENADSTSSIRVNANRRICSIEALGATEYHAHRPQPSFPFDHRSSMVTT